MCLDGGEPLVKEFDREFRLLAEQGDERPHRLGAEALGAVHILRQSDDDADAPVFLGGGGDRPGGIPHPAGFHRPDSGRDEPRRVGHREPRTDVTVINTEFLSDHRKNALLPHCACCREHT